MKYFPARQGMSSPLVIFPWMVSSAIPFPRNSIHQNSVSYLVIAWEQPLGCLPFRGKVSPSYQTRVTRCSPASGQRRRWPKGQRVKWHVAGVLGETQLRLTLQSIAPWRAMLFKGCAQRWEPAGAEQIWWQKQNFPLSRAEAGRTDAFMNLDTHLLDSQNMC